jgi:2-desacetyl-2-hydroxyethyl bacteriochlorophyllide A dehydrogenase
MKGMAIREFGMQLEWATLPDPEPRRGEVLLKVRACGVCRSDLKVIEGVLPITRRAKLPLIPGHEIVGVVEAVGIDVMRWRPGDRAVAHLYVGCGQCAACRDGHDTHCRGTLHELGFDLNGGYAEYVVVPARNLVRVSGGVSDAEAAILPDAVSTAVHAVEDQAAVRPGDRVLVVGAGGVGIHVVQLCALLGAHTTVVDLDDTRLALARQYGADESQLIRRLGDVRGAVRVGKVIDAAGALEDLSWAESVLDPGGIVVTVGYSVGGTMSFEVMTLIAAELEIRGCKASTFANLVTAVDLVERGRIRAVVGAEFAMSEANLALASVASGAAIGRAVLVPA